MTKRTVLAFVLAIAFFFTYSVFIQPTLFPQPERIPVETPFPETGATDSVLVASEGAVEPAAETPVAAADSPIAETLAPGGYEVPDEYKAEYIDTSDITVSTDLMTVVFTPISGAIKSVTLENFESFDRKGKLELLSDMTEGLYPTAITRIGARDVTTVRYRGEKSVSDDGAQQVTFTAVLDDGTKIQKVYTLFDGKYGVGIDVTIENLAASKRQLAYDILGPAGLPAEVYIGEGKSIQGVLATVKSNGEGGGKMSLRTKMAWQMLSGGDHVKAADEGLNFAGAFNQYFACVLRPDETVPVSSALCYAVEDSRKAEAVFGDVDPREAVRDYAPKAAVKRLEPFFYSAGAKVQIAKFDLEPQGAAGSSVTHSYLLYAGPKDKQALAAFDSGAGKGTGLTALLDYGMLDWFVKVILYLMWAFHSVIPNWGVAIILLTFLIRALMHPLTKRSQLSMAKMQKVQPEIQKLKEKYKNDKQKLGQEQMKLMKEAGANPLGGCLPMLIQLPIFFALYRALMVSIQLRQAPFVLWIKDLAQPDRLIAPLPFTLPILHNELNLLPLLLLGAMVVQQRMMPPPATPEAAQQQKMMAFFMPIFLGVILYRVASGLNLYILTSTVFGIVEQWIIRRHIAAGEKP